MIDKNKLDEWIDVYLKHIDDISIIDHVEKEERYKFEAVETFQNNFDIDAENLEENLKKSITNNNMVSGGYYFPRAMLLRFAKHFPKETKDILSTLFDENMSDIAERIDKTIKKIEILTKKYNKKLNENRNHFMGTRFLSLLLGYRFPEKYNPMKPREWKTFARFIDKDFRIPTHTSEGKKYNILSKYTDTLLEYIRNNKEINKIRNALTAGLDFDDSGYRWITQDVIYVTARILNEERDKSSHIQEEDSIEIEEEDEVITKNPEAQFRWEKHLEDFMIENWNSVGDSIESGLKLYIDEDGEVGQQVQTDSGAIDILATDKNNNFVVIELKKGRSNTDVVGQILHYMGWVSENLATNGQEVRGIIIVSDAHKRLKNAVKVINDKLQIKYYRVKMDFIEPK